MAFFLRVLARAAGHWPCGHTSPFCSKSSESLIALARQSLGSGAVPWFFELEQEHEHEERLSQQPLARKNHPLGEATSSMRATARPPRPQRHGSWLTRGDRGYRYRPSGQGALRSGSRVGREGLPSPIALARLIFADSSGRHPVYRHIPGST
jgi:hypothetical protein